LKRVTGVRMQVLWGHLPVNAEPVCSEVTPAGAGKSLQTCKAGHWHDTSSGSLVRGASQARDRALKRHTEPGLEVHPYNPSYSRVGGRKMESLKPNPSSKRRKKKADRILYILC
jgi:hypothetical protein